MNVNLHNLFVIIFVIANLLLSSGCCSYMNASSYQKEKAMQIRARGQGAEIGVDLLNMDILKDRPWQTIGSAIIDAFILGGTYYLTQNDSSNDSSTNTRNDIEINGDNNYVNINGSQDNSQTITNAGVE